MAKGNTKPAGNADNTAGNGEGGTQDFETKIAPANLPHLHALVLASAASAESFLVLPEAIAKALNEVGFADVWKDNGVIAVDADGNVKSRATADGIAYAEANPADPSTQFETSGDTEATNRRNSGYKRPENIEVDDNVPMPTAGARRTRTVDPAYPFDALEVGKSFHIPATPDCPDPAKSIASSVSTANKRWSKEIEVANDSEKVKARRKNEETGLFETTLVNPRESEREFFAQKVGKDDPRGAGVRVFRRK